MFTKKITYAIYFVNQPIHNSGARIVGRGGAQEYGALLLFFFFFCAPLTFYYIWIWRNGGYIQINIKLILFLIIFLFCLYLFFLIFLSKLWNNEQKTLYDIELGYFLGPECSILWLSRTSGVFMGGIQGY